MKLRSFLLLAAAIVIPATGFFVMPGSAEARGMGHGDRANATPEQRQAHAAEREAKMKAELGLSDAQVAQMKAVRTKYEPQHKALRAEAEALKAGGATREQMKSALGEKRKALHDQMKAEIKGILTPEQLAKMEAMKGDRGDRGGRGGRGGY